VYKAVDIVPVIFERCPVIDTIVIHGTATATDVKGNETVVDAARVTFTRKNAATILRRRSG